jgi:ferredoxin
MQNLIKQIAYNKKPFKKGTKMRQNVYKKLAKRFDAIPNGFPETDSGVELKLLAKIFTPEEAALASEMRLIPENTEQIAQRTNQDLTKTSKLLQQMVMKGQILGIKHGDQYIFSLTQFAMGGVYDFQLGRLDEEFAELFEEYYPIFAKRLLGPSPSIFKVIPVEESIPYEVYVHPYEQASAYLNKAKSFGVRNCICKTQKKLVGKPCKYPEEVCLVFAPVEGAFDYDPSTRAIIKEKAIKILRESEKAGLIHSSTNIQEGHFYLCNCCTCCCAIMRGISQLGLENSMAKSDFSVKVDPEACTGCATCMERCQFGALSLVDNISYVNQKRCVGCGQCTMSCPSKAITLVRKPEDQITSTPKNMSEWMMKRAKSRGISIQEVL